MRELRGGTRRRDRATTRLPRPASTTDTLSSRSMSPRHAFKVQAGFEGSFKPELAEGVSDVHTSMSLNSESVKSVARGRASTSVQPHPRRSQVQGGQRESWLSLWRLGQGRPLS